MARKMFEYLLFYVLGFGTAMIATALLGPPRPTPVSPITPGDAYTHPSRPAVPQNPTLQATDPHSALEGSTCPYLAAQASRCPFLRERAERWQGTGSCPGLEGDAGRQGGLHQGPRLLLVSSDAAGNAVHAVRIVPTGWF